MEFYPERRVEILAKREKLRQANSRPMQSKISVSDDSPLAQRLRKLSLMTRKDK